MKIYFFSLILSYKLLSYIALNFSQVAIFLSQDADTQWWGDIGSFGCLERAENILYSDVPAACHPLGRGICAVTELHSSTWVPFQQHEELEAPGEASWSTWKIGYS